MSFFPESEGWTELIDPRKATVEKLVRTAPRTERLALNYDNGCWDANVIPGIIEAARPLPLRGLRLVKLYAEHESDREIRDYSDTAPIVCDLTKTILPELAAAKWLSLDTLEVIAAKNGLIEIPALKKAACFQGLRRFVLGGWTKLPPWLRLPEARELVLEDVRYDEEKPRWKLIESATHLEVLWIDASGPQIVKALRKSSFLPKLRSLGLFNAGLQNDDLVALASLDRSFESLDLRYSPMLETGALALASSPSIAKCRLLDLRNIEIAAPIVVRLVEQFGDRVKLDTRPRYRRELV